MIKSSNWHMTDDSPPSSSSAKCCKVCLAAVKKRKDHHPSICEACQKFFQRHCKTGDMLLCTSGYGDCPMTSSARRFCTKCRFEKCLAAGMRSKYLPGSNSTNKTPSPTPKLEDTMTSSSPSSCSSVDLIAVDSSSNNSSENATAAAATASSILMPLVRDPVLYNGSELDRLLIATSHAFTRLHGFHFLALKMLEEPVTDMHVLSQLAANHIQVGTENALAYARYIVESEGLSASELDDLMWAGFGLNSVALFQCLNSHGKASFFGVSNFLKPIVLEHLPQLQNCWELSEKLEDELTVWNPTFAEVAILFGLVLFNESVCSTGKLFAIRKKLLTAMSLLCEREDRKAVRQAVAKRINKVLNCLQLAQQLEASLVTNGLLAVEKKPMFAQFYQRVASSFEMECNLTFAQINEKLLQRKFPDFMS